MFCWKLFFNCNCKLFENPIGVSILVLLEAVFQLWDVQELLESKNVVSILVLLEAVFQLGVYLWTAKNEQGFNPCFAGSCFSTTMAALMFVFFIMVSILVLLEAVFQLPLENRENHHNTAVSILVLLEAVFQQGFKTPYYAFISKIEQFFPHTHLGIFR
ncbi:hypothetical protein MSWH1_1690 [Methanosarcina sp. WH1]|nr:hypothetical protein MSWH1_1690 [Methanosarcina sp. WH1]